MFSHSLTAGLVLAAALTACAGDETTAPTRPTFAEDAGHNAAEHIKEINQVTFEVENPCNGEVIVFSGTEILQATFVGTEEALENGNSVHNQFQARTDATGVGAVSGAGYSLHDVFSQSFQSPSPPAPQFTASVRASTSISSSDPTLSFRLKLLVHAVLNPASGDLKLTKELEQATCTS